MSKNKQSELMAIVTMLKLGFINKYIKNSGTMGVGGGGAIQY